MPPERLRWSTSPTTMPLTTGCGRPGRVRPGCRGSDTDAVRDPALELARWRARAPSRSPTVTTGTRPPYATATNAGCPLADEDPAFDYLLMLLVETSGQPLTVLPTHRVVRGLGDAGVERLLAKPGRALRRPAGRSGHDRGAFLGRCAGSQGRFRACHPRGRGRADSPTRGVRAAPAGRRGCAPAPRRDAARRRASSGCAGSTRSAMAAGRAWPTRSQLPRRCNLVTGHVDGADTAFLLEPTPVADIAAVASAGRRHAGRKSTYFYPKRPPAWSSTRTSGDAMTDRRRTLPRQGDDRRGLPPSVRLATGRQARPQGRDRAAERGLYVESWLPERRSRRKPLLLVHGELAGSWCGSAG